MSIVAYSYLAALHCPHCTRSALPAYHLEALKKELRDFNMHTRTWKD